MRSLRLESMQKSDEKRFRFHLFVDVVDLLFCGKCDFSFVVSFGNFNVKLLKYFFIKFGF